MEIIALFECYAVAIMICVGAKIVTWIIDKDDDYEDWKK